MLPSVRAVCGGWQPYSKRKHSMFRPDEPNNGLRVTEGWGIDPGPRLVMNWMSLTKCSNRLMKIPSALSQVNPMFFVDQTPDFVTSSGTCCERRLVQLQGAIPALE
jgi:hypothetical protein